MTFLFGAVNRYFALNKRKHSTQLVGFYEGINAYDFITGIKFLFIYFFDIEAKITNILSCI